MPIRPTESTLPEGFNPVDLGQAHQIPGAGNAKYALVSYLTSPIAKDSVIDYVVFVVGETSDDAKRFSFKWTFTHFPSNAKKEKTTDEGIFSYKVDAVGELRVSVDVLRDGQVMEKLKLTQEIRELDPALEQLLDPAGMLKHLNVDRSLGSLGGNPPTSRELINNFQQYVLQAVGPPGNIDLPARFVAAILYAEILRVGKDDLFGRDAELKAVASELNGDLFSAPGTQSDNALGVAQITMQTLAMVIGPPPAAGAPAPGTAPATYTPWTEVAVDENKREADRAKILANLNNYMPEADRPKLKIDLFNLLRFPKSNIKMCARLLRRLFNREQRWNNVKRADLIKNEQALAIIATEYKIGATQSTRGPTTGPPGPTDAKPNEDGLEVVQHLMKLPPIVLFFADTTSNGGLAYGGLDLKRSKVAATPEEAPHVLALKQDLLQLGFGIVGQVNDSFDIRTEWAVREFQIYSGMPSVAAETGSGGRYLANLTQVPNVLRYTGRVSGELNAACRVALQYWKAKNWRCPVVFEASTKSGSTFTPIADKGNLWMPQEFFDPAASKYVRARDLSGYYDLPAGVGQNPADPNDLIVVGSYYSDQWTGPVSQHRHAWHGEITTEVMPKAFFGLDEQALGLDVSDLGVARRSTFKVIRVVSEVENLGYFDSINCWDTAYLSLGVCHWTIGRPGAAVDPGPEPNVEREGELVGYLAYLKHYEPDSFRKAIGAFGVDVDKTWGDDDDDPSGKKLFKKEQRKYSGWLSLEQGDGTFQTVDDPPYKTTAIDADTEDRECGQFYFKTWHWFYRFQMAARTIQSFKQRMWDFARIRLRDILTVPWGVSADANNQITPDGRFTDGRGTERPIELGDVFTSERAVALLLRWHINRPVQVVSYDSGANAYKPAAKLLQAFGKAKAKAGTNFKRSPKEWGEAEESALIQGILETAINPADLQLSMNFVDKFPPSNDTEEYGWHRNVRGYELKLDQLTVAIGETSELKKLRHSFKFFFDKDLPSAPYAREVAYYDWG